MKRSRKVLILYGCRHHLNLQENSKQKETLISNFSATIVNIWKIKTNVPIRLDYVLSKLHRTFGKQKKPTDIELEVTCTHEQNCSQIAVNTCVWGWKLHSARYIHRMQLTKACQERMEWNWESAVSGCTRT